MKKAPWLRDFVIGLVFLGGLGIFGAVTMKVASLDIFGATREVEVPFSNVNDLRVGNDVRFHGLKIGLVTEIRPSFSERENKLRVRCRIPQGFSLPMDSRFLVRSAGALGGRYVEIVPGVEPEVPIETGAFTGSSEKDLFEAVGELVDEIRGGRGLLHQIIHNQTVGQDFESIVAEVRQIVRSVNEGEGLLGSLIKNTELRDRAEKAITDLGEMVKGIREGEGTVALLINDPETRERVRTFIADAQEIARSIKEGKGTVGKLINEPELYEDLKSAVADVKEFVKDAQEGKGTLAMLASDEEFKQDLKDGVRAFREIATDIQNGEGTIGQLMKNRELYDRASRLLDNTSDAVEDFREQAPINAFVNVLFSGF
jgi:phospholipid/cholesterol/gamma-HCH transport system substrate-binding protein